MAGAASSLLPSPRRLPAQQVGQAPPTCGRPPAAGALSFCGEARPLLPPHFPAAPPPRQGMREEDAGRRGPAARSRGCAARRQVAASPAARPHGRSGGAAGPGAGAAPGHLPCRRGVRRRSGRGRREGSGTGCGAGFSGCRGGGLWDGGRSGSPRRVTWR